MGTQILEGTIAELQQALGTLPYGPDKRLRAIVTEQEGMNDSAGEPFRPVEFRNGVPLLPRHMTAEPITLELLKRLLEEGEMGGYGAD